MSSTIETLRAALFTKYNFYTPRVCEKLKRIVYHYSNPDKVEILIREINKKQAQEFESPYQTIQFLNTNDEMSLRNFDILNFETKRDIFEDKIHLNQIICAFKIFVNFVNDKRYNVLCAQFQSGKTGTSICILFFFHSFRILLYLFDITIEGAVIFSGLSFTSLRDQWHDKLEKYKGLPKNFKEIVWGEDLKKCYEKYNNRILIHDESYRVSGNDMRVHKFYSLQQLKPSYNAENYKNRNIFILSVCATPFAELIRNQKDNQQKEIVILTPGRNYVSLKIIREHYKLKSAYKINEENKAKLEEDIQDAFDYYDSFRGSLTNSDYSNSIIRLPDGKTRLNKDRIEIIQDIANENGWDVKFIQQNRKDDDENVIENFEQYFKQRPTNDTIIIIHQKLGLGDNLEKKYISMGFEYTNYKNGELTTKQDNMLQGLPGRFCSYYNSQHIPFIFCDINTVNEYIEFADSEFTNFQKIPPNSMHIKVEKSQCRRENPHYSMIIPIRNVRHYIENERWRTHLLESLRGNHNVDIRRAIKEEIVEYLENMSVGRFYNNLLNKDSIVNNIIQKLKNDLPLEDGGNNGEDLYSFRNFGANNGNNMYQTRDDLKALITLSKNPRNQTLAEYALNSKYFSNEDKIEICYSHREDVLFIYAYIFDEENHQQIHEIGQRGVTSLIGTDMFKGDLIEFNNGNVCRNDVIDLERVGEDFDYTFGIILRKLRAKTHSGYDIENPIGKFFYIRENLVPQYKKTMRKTLRKEFGSSLSIDVKMKRASKREEKEGYKVCKFIKVRK